MPSFDEDKREVDGSKRRADLLLFNLWKERKSSNNCIPSRWLLEVWTGIRTSTMFPLFGKSSKSPTEVVKALRESLNTLEKGGDPKKEEKAQEEVI